MIKTIVSNYDGNNLDEIVKELQLFMHNSSLRVLHSSYYDKGSRVPITELRMSMRKQMNRIRKILSELEEKP